jgi:hypothetical protein
MLTLGGSGIWKSAKVISVGEMYIIVEYIGENQLLQAYAFPNTSNSHYMEHQWSRKGFLRKKITIVCTCGADKTYGKANNLHTNYCDKKRAI